jgi:hypothetical protein
VPERGLGGLPQSLICCGIWKDGEACSENLVLSRLECPSSQSHPTDRGLWGRSAVSHGQRMCVSRHRITPCHRLIPQRPWGAPGRTRTCGLPLRRLGRPVQHDVSSPVTCGSFARDGPAGAIRFVSCSGVWLLRKHLSLVVVGGHGSARGAGVSWAGVELHLGQRERGPEPLSVARTSLSLWQRCNQEVHGLTWPHPATVSDQVMMMPGCDVR